MNIKISKKEHEFLLEFKNRSIIMGSHLYGVNNSKSDVDYLMFYSTPETWFLDGFPNIHQFQYTENNVDYIWTNKKQFWDNQRSGDNTINSDIILFSEQLWGDLEAYRLEYCRTYKVIKAYLGFTKRDLKYYKEGIHKIKHASRSLIIAQHLLNNDMPSLDEIRNEYEYIENRCKDIYKFKLGLEEEEKRLRERCNKMYENKELEMYYIPTVEDNLLQKLLDSNNTREFKY